MNGLETLCGTSYVAMVVKHLSPDHSKVPTICKRKRAGSLSSEIMTTTEFGRCTFDLFSQYHLIFAMDPHEAKLVKLDYSFTVTFSGFSRLLCKIGEFSSSPPISIGGHIWSVKLYPGGVPPCAGYMACYVALESEGEIKAKCKISIVIPNGQEVPVYQNARYDSFTKTKSCGTWSCPISHYQQQGCIVHDKLVIKVDLSVNTDSFTTCISSTEVASNSMVKDISNLLLDNSISDVTIHVNTIQFPVHKAILYGRSEVFRAMFNSPMKEAESHIVEINDFEPEVVREFLHFVYTDSCTTPQVVETHSEKLLAIACKYQVKGLETLCENHLCSTLTVDNIVSVLLLADMYSARHLKTRALQFIARNAKAVKQSEGFKRLNGSLLQDMISVQAGSE